MTKQVWLYHASNFRYEWPDETMWESKRKADITGNRRLGLFCNSQFDGLHVYGKHLYKFKLSSASKLLEIPDEMRQAGYCQSYYLGVRHALSLLGYDAVKASYDGGAGYTILNFAAIDCWEYVGEIG